MITIIAYAVIALMLVVGAITLVALFTWVERKQPEHEPLEWIDRERDRREPVQ